MAPMRKSVIGFFPIFPSRIGHHSSSPEQRCSRIQRTYIHVIFVMCKLKHSNITFSLDLCIYYMSVLWVGPKTGQNRPYNDREIADSIYIDFVCVVEQRKVHLNLRWQSLLHSHFVDYEAGFFSVKTIF